MTEKSSESLELGEHLLNQLNHSLMPTWKELNSKQRVKLLEKAIGTRRMNLHSAIPMSIYFVLIFIIGVSGNILSCLIILTNGYMRIPQNFFLVSLSIIDLINLTFGKLNLYFDILFLTLIHALTWNLF